jgi:hypothetical protein
LLGLVVFFLDLGVLLVLLFRSEPRLPVVLLFDIVALELVGERFCLLGVDWLLTDERVVFFVAFAALVLCEGGLDGGVFLLDGGVFQRGLLVELLVVFVDLF